ncbi:lanthionine synthetase C family protein [Longirhabdus pacifica]|uniref:lanthionine synthetase C family protein n=1 Tax=Longirhabdus pacifica TaxID=2305227 RepID=UPI001008CB98|nr:lanthionine synthetase C family protein [Longirhabdus pacifica]
MAWSSVTEERMRDNILRIVNEGANRLTSPEFIQKNMLDFINKRKEEGADYIPWSAIDLARGYSGFCVLFGALDRANPNEDWDHVGHAYLQEIQEALNRDGIPSFSLWTGLAGVVIAARSLSREGERYENFISELNSIFLSSFPDMMEYMHAQLEQGPALDQFDVIQGLSGIGRYVLCFSHEQEMRQALEHIILYCIKLSECRLHNGLYVPGWFVSYDNYTGYNREDYPDGHFNCGLSHGIPGVLSLLSIALAQGVEVEGQRDAIHNMVQWLLKWKGKDEFGHVWPAMISWEQHQQGKVENLTAHEAWCYGSPGVARAVWLSGVAMDNDEWKTIAIETYRGIAVRPEEKWHIQSDTLCHGYAGLLQMVQRMYSESSDEIIGTLRDDLVQKVLQRWKSDRRYGFQESEGEDRQDLPGLLDGAAGVFTVLNGLLQEQDSDWDLIFLIR